MVDKKKNKKDEVPWARVSAKDFSKKVYGKDFASKVADTLEKRGSLFQHDHRDFCGMGMGFRDEKYRFGHVTDSCFLYDFKEFETKNDFIDWLSKKNDFNMSGIDPNDDLYEKNEWYRNHERICKSQLEMFLSGKYENGKYPPSTLY